ncbi:serine hydrolase domain-containing protein [Sulfitobacter delicatus]|uniref:CubicO group peptidase, beta-lactamase class C family n=1 Tax=Sulfitobacter delicatus TaxID=218672 RepID=A0A1G7TAQ2_9RHOB|nr:serine hydrolase [Sulfitobacter delicatus]SDG31709.1 CubicO group peptidase, beta-lactamase class C family [Sulfitobacter delicatus]
MSFAATPALQSVVDHALAHETEWPRSMYHPDGSYVGNREWNESGPWTEIVGPVKPRGGPAGVILQRGERVASWGDTTRPDMTFSIAKSYLSVLAGLAVKDGLIADLDAQVGDSVPGQHFSGDHNGRITWRHMLQMNSEWRGEIFGKDDQVDHYRQIGVGADNSRKGQLREVGAPGSYYEYNDVRVNALAYALLCRFGRPLPEVLRERIMDPIGASGDWRWEGYSTSWVELGGKPMQSVTGGGHWGGGLFIGADDHAKFGQFILQNGQWNGEQILPEDWMQQSRTPTPTLDKYGFLWWLNRGQDANPNLPATAFSAQGAGGHSIWIAPDQEIVAVMRWLAPPHTPKFLELLVAALNSPTRN